MIIGLIVDKEDEHFVIDHKWSLSNGYARSKINGSNVMLHHLVIGFPPEGLETDHKNRNRLDNRRSNLRHVTHQENLLNRDSWGKSLRGVYFDKTNKRTKPYKAYKRINGKSHNIGYYSTPEEAHKAYLDYNI